MVHCRKSSYEHTVNIHSFVIVKPADGSTKVHESHDCGAVAEIENPKKSSPLPV